MESGKFTTVSLKSTAGELGKGQRKILRSAGFKYNFARKAWAKQVKVGDTDSRKAIRILAKTVPVAKA